MTKEEFVEALITVAENGAVRGTFSMLEVPPGRERDARQVQMSNWFHSLDQEDVLRLKDIVQYACSLGIYIVLGMLDGQIAFEPAGPKGQLELYYANRDERMQLNSFGNEFLTDIYKSRVMSD